MYRESQTKVYFFFKYFSENLPKLDLQYQNSYRLIIIVVFMKKKEERKTLEKSSYPVNKIKQSKEFFSNQFIQSLLS